MNVNVRCFFKETLLREKKKIKRRNALSLGPVLMIFLFNEILYFDICNLNVQSPCRMVK